LPTVKPVLTWKNNLNTEKKFIDIMETDHKPGEFFGS